jgi:DNA-binding protein
MFRVIRNQFSENFQQTLLGEISHSRWRDDQQHRRHKTMAEKPEGNVVFIGTKPVMNYVLAVITQFNMGSGGVTLKARGKAISRAVDVAEIVRNRFLQSLKVKSISIGTEELQAESGTINVSTLEIALGKGEKTPFRHFYFFIGIVNWGHYESAYLQRVPEEQHIVFGL